MRRGLRPINSHAIRDAEIVTMRRTKLARLAGLFGYMLSPYSRNNGNDKRFFNARNFEEVLGIGSASAAPVTSQVNTYCRVREYDRGTRSPLAANTQAACECSAPVSLLEDFPPGRLLDCLVELLFGLDTMLDNAILVVLNRRRQQASATLSFRTHTTS